MKRKIAAVVAAIGLGLSMSACSSDADVASHNLSKDAENFKVQRRIVFYNGITDSYMLEVRGLCSVEWDGPVTVTCKTDQGFVKHFLGTSDNVTWFAEQLRAKDVSTKHYKVIFKPSEIVPAPELR